MLRNICNLKLPLLRRFKLFDFDSNSSLYITEHLWKLIIQLSRTYLIRISSGYQSKFRILKINVNKYNEDDCESNHLNGWESDIGHCKIIIYFLNNSFAHFFSYRMIEFKSDWTVLLKNDSSAAVRWDDLLFLGLDCSMIILIMWKNFTWIPIPLQIISKNQHKFHHRPRPLPVAVDLHDCDMSFLTELNWELSEDDPGIFISFNNDIAAHNATTNTRLGNACWAECWS